MGPASPPRAENAVIGENRILTRESQPAAGGQPVNQGDHCPNAVHVIAQPPVAVPSEASAATVTRPPARASADGVEGQLCGPESSRCGGMIAQRALYPEHGPYPQHARAPPNRTEKVDVEVAHEMASMSGPDALNTIDTHKSVPITTVVPPRGDTAQGVLAMASAASASDRCAPEPTSASSSTGDRRAVARDVLVGDVVVVAFRSTR